MDQFFDKLELSITHLRILHELFKNRKKYNFPTDQDDYDIYKENLDSLNQTFNNLGVFDQLYKESGRQMILADLFEYVLLGRGFYSMGNRRPSTINKEQFIKGILHFVNLLMCFESMTIDTRRRNQFLSTLKRNIPITSEENDFEELQKYKGIVGISDVVAPEQLNNYFDTLLPKTAGGLWHELLVYIFIIRNNLGFILPLLLHQKIYSKDDHLVPPDFFLLTKDRRIIGIEVGRKKEIQSGSFSIRTNIPTATIDTINSRNSDRCPICRKWINFCPYVIDKYSDFNSEINHTEVRCLQVCTLFTPDQVISGACKFSKYSRRKAVRILSSKHQFADGKHYHFKCILKNIPKELVKELINHPDNTAIKTHFPNYSGLEDLT